MNEKNLKEKLYKRLEQEYKEYLTSLENTSFKNIIDNSYQIAIKEEFVEMFYPSNEYDVKDIKTLLKTNKPLNELYQGWMDNELGIHQILEYGLEKTYEDIRENLKLKKELNIR